MALNTQIKTEIATFVATAKTLDTSSKSLFTLAKEQYKGFTGNKQALGKITKELNAEVKLHTNEKVLQKRATLVFSIARDYQDFGFLAKFDHLRWYNIEGLAKLGAALTKDKDLKPEMVTEIYALNEDVKVPKELSEDILVNIKGAIKAIVAKIWHKDMNTEEYNNATADILHDLKNILGYSDVEGQFQKLIHNFEAIVQELNIEQITALMAKAEARKQELSVAPQAEVEEIAKTA